jgi:hypothetical protein
MSWSHRAKDPFDPFCATDGLWPDRRERTPLQVE